MSGKNGHTHIIKGAPRFGSAGVYAFLRVWLHRASLTSQTLVSVDADNSGVTLELNDGSVWRLTAERKGEKNGN